PGAGGDFGDMLIELTVETPVNLSSRQRELLREFEAEKSDNSPQSDSFFAKVKSFWDGMTR
ncbi:MAG: molecular chaperone DnaJ, partial [Hyphomonas sp.]